MVHQCLEHGHNQDYVHDDRLTRWEDSQLLEEAVEQKQSMSPPFKKNFVFFHTLVSFSFCKSTLNGRTSTSVFGTLPFSEVVEENVSVSSGI